MADAPDTASTTAEPPAPAPAPTPSRELTADNPWFWGTGRRKTSVARVRLRPGTGRYVIQVKRASKKVGDAAFRDVNDYFSEERDRNDAHAPLKATNTLGRVDIVARLDGGGTTGQAGALMLGVARALKDFDPNLEPVLREHGYLTRDDREVERKKYGQRGARRRFQFSKR
ncbi:MAG: 30S ribosomal protein S9 [Planctomycetota bacterium]|nr:MAG: 30S ribosomal protein S9 [Planctomycetota bacterium]